MKLYLNMFFLWMNFSFGLNLNAQTDNRKEDSRPNIVFILADDLGWADLPVYGNKFNEAPNISALAENGMLFNNAYMAAPVCSPSRASILAGQYPARLGVTDFITGHWWPFEKLTVPVNKTQHLPLEIKTVGELLQQAGYKTGYFGKWHLGGSDFYPDKQGFDESVVYAGGGHYGAGFEPAQQFPGEVRLSEALTELSVQFIEKNRDEPFFLFLSHYDVHVPLDADSMLTDQYLKKIKMTDYPGNAIYAAMIEHLDQSVGQILRKLEQAGLKDNTIIFFTSDNGGLVTRGDLGSVISESKRSVYHQSELNYISTSNFPLRDERGSLYEGGIRVPFLASWPGQIQAGSLSEIPITSVDILPTLIDLAGAQLPEDQVFDGKSIKGVLFGAEDLSGRPLFWHYPHYHHSQPSGAVRLGSFKLIEFYDDSHLELYDLEEDIGEKNNLAKEMPMKANQLWSLLFEWRKEINAEFPRPNPGFNPHLRKVMGTHPDRK